MFLLNSRLGLFSVTKKTWLPFSLSYGNILPSSLTMFLLLAFEFSSRPPVSVYGTGIYKAIVAFLVSVDSSTSLLYFHSPSHFNRINASVLLTLSLCAWPGFSIPRFD